MINETPEFSVEPDEAVMARCRAGDESAFAELERRYRRRVWSVCRRVLLDPTEADDAAQQTFVKIWLNRETFSEDRHFWAWARAIAVKTCVDNLRSVERRREVPLEGHGDTLESRKINTLPLRHPDEDARMLELRVAFSDCWRLLPGHYRGFLQFIDWTNWQSSWADLATLTGRSPASVRVATIRYARLLLDCLRSKGFQPSPSELLQVLEDKAYDKKEI